MLVIGGEQEEVPGLEGTNFTLDGRLAIGPDDKTQRSPGTWIRGIVLHTRMSSHVTLRSGKGPGKNWDLLVSDEWRRDGRPASAHIAVDADGSYACLADLERDSTYHAGHVNQFTIGIEMYLEWPSCNLWQSTIDTTVRLVDYLTLAFGIQRQFPREEHQCKRFARPGALTQNQPSTLPGGRSGRDFCGVYGHRHINRWKPYDPDYVVFRALEEAGYEGFLVEEDSDKDEWGERQLKVGMSHEDADGVPGPLTLEQIRSWQDRQGKACGVGNGMWKTRPIDDEVAARF